MKFFDWAQRFEQSPVHPLEIAIWCRIQKWFQQHASWIQQLDWRMLEIPVAPILQLDPTSHST
jgi:hypothetical protein